MEEKRIKYFTAKLHNFQFDIADFAIWYKGLLSTPPGMRRRIPGLSSDRADVIVAGSSIIKALADKCNSKNSSSPAVGSGKASFANTGTSTKTCPSLRLTSLKRAATT
ncbi:MAG: hypothetical protein ACLVLA_08595 [Acidaminococcus intestini]